jgi:tyrosine-protein kinase Etk/Wzc
VETLLQEFTAAHPDVQNLDVQIREISNNMVSDLRAQDVLLKRRQDEIEAELRGSRGQYQALPGQGLNLARLMREVQVNQEVFSLLSQREQEARIREAAKLEEVTIVSPALVPLTPKNPPITLNVLFVGFLLGAVLGIVFAFIVESVDTSIAAIEDVEAVVAVPVVGVIPHVDMEAVKESIAEQQKSPASDGLLNTLAWMVAQFDPRSTIAESFRALRTNAQFMGVEKGLKTFAVTSTQNAEGKSFVSFNLAAAMAQAGRKTLLIDADFRRAIAHKVLGIDRAPGISDVLVGNMPPGEAIRPMTDVLLGKLGFEDLMASPGLGNLSVMTTGIETGNLAELLYAPRFKELLEQLRGEYDIVILDSPPVLQASDAALLSSVAEGTLVVYRVGQVARSALKRTKAQLENVRANIVGVILNSVRPEVSPDFTDMRYYEYYAYGAERKGKRRLLEAPRRWLPDLSSAVSAVPEWVFWAVLAVLFAALVLAGWFWLGSPWRPGAG